MPKVVRMQAKSQDRRSHAGNDNGKQPQRPARFTSSTKGIRLRPQQLEWVNAQLAADPEQTYSRLVREGLDLLKKKREGLIQVLTPAR